MVWLPYLPSSSVIPFNSLSGKVRTSDLDPSRSRFTEGVDVKPAAWVTTWLFTVNRGVRAGEPSIVALTTFLCCIVAACLSLQNVDRGKVQFQLEFPCTEGRRKWSAVSECEGRRAQSTLSTLL